MVILPPVGWTIVVRTEGAADREIDVSADLVVGRAVEGPGNLPTDRKISRKHIRFAVTGDGGLQVVDLGSANGTSVNGENLAPQTPRALAAGDRVEAGDSTLIVGGSPATGGGAATPATEAISPSAAVAAAAGPIEQVGSPSSIRPMPARAGSSASADIIRDGRREPIEDAGMTIGRDPDNDLVIENPSASRRHAVIVGEGGRHYVSDLGGGNGTLLNGEVLRNASRWLNSGDSIEIGHEQLRYITGEQTMFGAAPQQEPRAAQVVSLEGATMTIGRDPGNDLVLDDPNVSRFHAEVRRTADGAAELRDLGSRNGTRLDRQFIRQRAPIRAGSEIGIGPFRLVYDGTNFVRRDDRGALRLRAEGITMAIKDKVILNGATIAIEPGEFVVIIGESGSGKTTMLKALAGVTTPTAGRVLVSGEPVLTRLTDIGYVPQDEIVHRGLTVLEGLRYSAALRLPRDSSQADIDSAVERVLGELGLEQHADTLVGSLSGGQRKRVGVGTELLNRPSLLFLDEPTTGLDPGLETQLMELFRELAEEGTRAVAAVTHATKNLHLADKVCVMGVGGELAFFGPPEEAKAFFGVDSFDGIYTALETRPATEWRARFEATEPEFLATVEQRDSAAPAKPPPRPQPNVGRQTALLAQRYAKLLLRDRRNLMILLGQAPLIALGIALLFQKGVLDVGADPTNAALMLFLVVTTMIWLGSIDGSREVIKERPLMERERAVGVKVSAYLSSKAIVLFGLVALQALLLVAVTFGIRPLPEFPQEYVKVFAICSMTGFVSVGMGLLISSLVSSEDQAASFIPLALIPQLLFGGAIVAVADMGKVIAAFSNVIYSRWAFADIGSAIDMRERIESLPPDLAQSVRYDPDFFNLSILPGLVILAGFTIVVLAITYGVLRAYRRVG